MLTSPGGSGHTTQKLRNHHPLMGVWGKDPAEMAEAGGLLREGQGRSSAPLPGSPWELEQPCVSQACWEPQASLLPSEPHGPHPKEGG